MKMKLKPYEAITEVIKLACKGIGTEDLLTCCIIRNQNIMGQVQFANEELFGKSISDCVRSECSSYYKDLLLEILNTVCAEDS